MSIYKKYKQIIEKIFQSDKSFTGALDKACIHIVNYSPDSKSYKSSELVSGCLHSHSLHRKCTFNVINYVRSFSLLSSWPNIAISY